MPSFVDWEDRHNDVVAELSEAQQECAEQISACAEKDVTIAELKETNAKCRKVYNKFVLDHGIFAKGLHELNNLRTTVQDLQNLNKGRTCGYMGKAADRQSGAEPRNWPTSGGWGGPRIFHFGFLRQIPHSLRPPHGQPQALQVRILRTSAASSVQ